MINDDDDIFVCSTNTTTKTTVAEEARRRRNQQHLHVRENGMRVIEQESERRRPFGHVE